MNDVWIEVNQMSQDIAPFCRSHAVTMSEYGAGTAKMVVQFNLTAYVKHLIEQSKDPA